MLNQTIFQPAGSLCDRSSIVAWPALNVARNE